VRQFDCHCELEFLCRYSGDTMPCDGLIQAGKNADLLIHEATIEDDPERGQDTMEVEKSIGRQGSNKKFQSFTQLARAKGHTTINQAIKVAYEYVRSFLRANIQLTKDSYQYESYSLSSYSLFSSLRQSPPATPPE
jgi:hypothetical protein